jgi:hypothetical protein
MDNAPVCDVIACTVGLLLLQKYKIDFHEENNHIRCMAHVVNLVVQAFLASLDEADNPDNYDWFIPNKHLPVHYDPDDDDEVQAWENEPEIEADNNEGNLEFEDPMALDDDDQEELEKLDKQDIDTELKLSPIKKVSHGMVNGTAG